MWITILEILAIITFIFLVGFLDIKSKMLIDIEKLIAEAEKINASGAKKMEYVVGNIYTALVPFAKAYFTKERIQSIAQAVFDRIRAYAENYIANK